MAGDSLVHLPPRVHLRTWITYLLHRIPTVTMPAFIWFCRLLFTLPYPGFYRYLDAAYLLLFLWFWAGSVLSDPSRTRPATFSDYTTTPHHVHHHAGGRWLPT